MCPHRGILLHVIIKGSVLLDQMVTIIIISTPEEDRDSELSDWP